MPALQATNGIPIAPLNPAGENGSKASPPSGPAPASDRDARGRFAAGNKGGPGNPFARRVAGLRQAMLEAVAKEDVRAIIGRIVEAAKNGDVAAARLVLAYTVGKPAPAVDPDTLDLHEWALWQQMPIAGQTLLGMLSPLQVPIACMIARVMLPLLQGQLGQHLAQQLDPSLATPPVPGQPQAQTAAPAAPPASPAPAASAEQATPRPGTAPPAEGVASDGVQAPPRKEKREKKRTGQVTGEPVRPAAAEPNGQTGAAQPDLNQLLALCQQLLGPAPPAGEETSDQEFDRYVQSLLQT